MGTSRLQFTASSGRPLSQIAGEPGIAASMLRSWRDVGDRGNAGSTRRSNTQAAIPPALRIKDSRLEGIGRGVSPTCQQNCYVLSWQM